MQFKSPAMTSSLSFIVKSELNHLSIIILCQVQAFQIARHVLIEQMSGQIVLTYGSTLDLMFAYLTVKPGGGLGPFRGGRMIIRSQMKTGCKILWHSEYDKKVISYLKREFGC